MTTVNTAPTTWWQQSLTEVGVRSMEKLLPQDATWEQVLASGRADLQRGLERTKWRPTRAQTVVDIGCGVGRMSQALAEYAGRVVGVDIAPALLAEAREKNRAPQVSFEQLDGKNILVKSVAAADAVFSYEVLYLIPPPIVATYFQDIFALLKPEGEFVFQMNLHPMGWKTHVARRIRGLLRLAGVKEWRGWPTSTQLRRYPYDRKWVCRTLADAGFQVVRVAGDNLRQTWFVARKPAASGA
jgi:SAM-dependent methyltransferase